MGFANKVLKIILIVAIITLIALLAAIYLHHRADLNTVADSYAARAAEEKAWILSCQTQDGLILYKQWGDSGADEQTVSPYFSSIAAWGLLAGTVTDEQSEGARRYIDWYLDHLNTAAEDTLNGAGTVYDYLVTRLEDGTIVTESTGDYDSVDSYAALFLIVAERYAEKVDAEYLSGRCADLLRVADALLATLGENHLSFVKTEYPVQYLMDNAEVYAGLRAGASLFERIGTDDELVSELTSAADALTAALYTELWDEENDCYAVALDWDGEQLQSELWGEFYPDSVAQLFPECFGVSASDDERSARLYEGFCAAWDWETLSHVYNGDSTFYWCVLAYAAAIHGDEARVNSFIESYDALLNDAGRGYPLYTGDAGWFALACGEMEDSYRDRIW